jgi:CO dehydrogenase maturation factor
MMKTQIIATAGKGGTGKSMTLSHILKRHILGNGFGPVLVVDADPHQSLAHLLGVNPKTNLGKLRHQYAQELKTGLGLGETSRRDFARQLAEEALIPIEGGDLLVMGHNDQAGCQCVVNNILGNTLDAIASQYSLIVIDNEAGIEPIGRHNWPVDYLLLFSSPKEMELEVAWKILERASEVKRKIGFTGLLLNRTHVGQNLSAVYSGPHTAVLGTLPYSEQLDQEERPDETWLASLDQAWHYLEGMILQQGVQTGHLSQKVQFRCN